MIIDARLMSELSKSFINHFKSTAEPSKVNIKLSCVMRILLFCVCKNTDADQLRGNGKADHAFVFTSKIVQCLYFLNLKLHTLDNSLILIIIVSNKYVLKKNKAHPQIK